MSLINEALKKARLEAAQRDAARRGVLVPKAAGYEPRRRGGRWIAAAVAAMFALGLAAAGGMWLAGRRAGEQAEALAEAAPPAPAEPAPAAAVPETVPAPAAPPAPVEPVEPVEPEEPIRWAAAEPPAAAPAAPPSPAASAPAPREPAPVPSAPAAPEAEPAPPANPRPEPERREAEAPSPATGYVREAPLQDGGTLRLDGIAWSETTPAAVIDGQIVGPGERVHGVRVLRVERDLVVLEVDGAELTVRLH